MNWHCKKFDQLTSLEVYTILRLRSAIFVVEQNCVFEDMDGNDMLPLHLFCTENEKVIAYARIFGPDTVFKEPSIGRVCTALSHRNQGLGKELMTRAVDQTDQLYPGHALKIGAQTYLKRFYESFEFTAKGEPYMEDGIEHIYMMRPIK